MKAEMFEDLEVWKLGRELVSRAYTLVRKGHFARDFALRDQILRSSISVPSNIAEGFERETDKEFSRFLYYAKGSAGETRSQLYHALDQEYIDKAEFDDMRELCLSLSRQLGSFIRYLESSDRKKRNM